MADDQSWPPEAIHLLRTTQMHHVTLSVMADNKANMLIGATFVVLTLTIGQADRSGFSLPLLVLALSAFASASLAAISVMPLSNKKSAGKAKQGQPNWLFFGVFAQMEEQVFVEHMLEEIKTTEGNFRAMLHDTYQLGCVLAAKKYRFLGWAYQVFIFGLSLTVFTFILERFTGPLL